MGLPWPEAAPPELASRDRTKGANHWSFQPVAKPEIPADHVGHPIDYFIDRRLAEAELEPAPLADRATRYRRAHFGLLGLPPAYDEREAFVNDSRPDSEAWPELVDRLSEGGVATGDGGRSPCASSPPSGW